MVLLFLPIEVSFVQIKDWERGTVSHRPKVSVAMYVTALVATETRSFYLQSESTVADIKEVHSKQQNRNR